MPTRKEPKQDADETTERPARSRSRRRNNTHVRKARRLGAQAYAEGRDLIDDAQGFLGTAQKTVSEAHAAIVEHAHARPYLLLGGALMTGYVLGRRLPPSLGRAALAYGSRAALSLLMRQVLS